MMIDILKKKQSAVEAYQGDGPERPGLLGLVASCSGGLTRQQTAMPDTPPPSVTLRTRQLFPSAPGPRMES